LAAIREGANHKEVAAYSAAVVVGILGLDVPERVRDEKSLVDGTKIAAWPFQSHFKAKFAPSVEPDTTFCTQA
jgi:hypothetical protein